MGNWADLVSIDHILKDKFSCLADVELGPKAFILSRKADLIDGTQNLMFSMFLMFNKIFHTQ